MKSSRPFIAPSSLVQLAFILGVVACSGSSGDPGTTGAGGAVGSFGGLSGVGGAAQGPQGGSAQQSFGGGATQQGGASQQGQGGSAQPGQGGSTQPGQGGSTSASGGKAAGGSTTASGGKAAGGSTSASGGKAAGGSTTASGGKAAGGSTSASGGKAAGGSTNASGGKASGGTGMGGAASGGTPSYGGSTSPTGSVFNTCRFHFGTGDWNVKSGDTIIPQIDYFTSGWVLGYTSFQHGEICTRSASGGLLAGKLPVIMMYAAAGYVKTQHKLCDCNQTSCSGGGGGDLCKYGSQYITQDWATILSIYSTQANGFANCMGGRPIVFAMEPDWYQYTGSSQTQPWSAAQAGTNMNALVNQMKSVSSLKGYFSMDISPWIPNNGSAWYSNFNMSLFTFINTSGGGTNASTSCSSGATGRIRCTDAMTWAGVNQVTGKPILADTGYGAGGTATGEDTAWNSASNINARIADGVVGIIQYAPGSSWGNTIAGIRSQLSQPKYCP